MSLCLYHIAPRYRKVEIWTGCALSRERIGVFTSKPVAGKTHRQRYDIIAAKMREHGIGAPIYHPNF